MYYIQTQHVSTPTLNLMETPARIASTELSQQCSKNAHANEHEDTKFPAGQNTIVRSSSATVFPHSQDTIFIHRHANARAITRMPVKTEHPIRHLPHHLPASEIGLHIMTSPASGLLPSLPVRGSDLGTMRSVTYSKNDKGALERSKTSLEDPLNFVLHPPSNETQEQQRAREYEEAEAKKRNEDIEKQIREEAGRMRGERATEKTILLLGQSEAGKTTILKQMRIMYDPERQARLREAWVDVIYLNVVLTVKALVNAHHKMKYGDCQSSIKSFSSPPTSPGSEPASYPFSNSSSLTPASALSSPSQRTSPGSFTHVQIDRSNGGVPSVPQDSVNRLLLSRLRLAPLLSTEEELRSRLGAFDEPQQRKQVAAAGMRRDSDFDRLKVAKPETANLFLKSTWQEDYLSAHGECELEQKDSDSMIEQTFVIVNAARKISNLIRPSSKQGSQNTNRPSSKQGSPNLARPSSKKGLEGLVRPTSKQGAQSRPSTAQSLKKAFGATLKIAARDTHTSDSNNAPPVSSVVIKEPSEEHKRMQRLLEACVSEVVDLWLEVQAMQGGLQLVQSGSAAYFLDNLQRIAQSGYCPTDDDILRARVRTVGVYEERFVVDKSLHYRIIDVGGSRTQRNVWAQFFSDATAIIFLAPVSTFDEVLPEQKNLNKLKDSVQLWEGVVSSPLLSQVSLILFLNKIDVLKSKLKAGRMVKNHFPRYAGDNNFDSVLRFFRSMFKTVYNRHKTCQSTRSVYVYKTTATSTREVRTILLACQDIILKQHLKESALA